MEYFVGAAITLFILFFAKYFYQIEKNTPLNLKLAFRQSHIFEVTRPTINAMLSFKQIDTQATRHFDSKHLKVVLTETKAYWIKDSSVYEADILDGTVQENSAKVVDMMALDDVKLKDMMFIIDKLTEEQPNDRRDSWES